ncbi:MAG: hypothetical protein NVSMB29_00140 [Candidatus Dormibacteria bacterium]
MIGPGHDEDLEKAVGSAFLSLMRAVQADISVLGDVLGLARLMAGEAVQLLPDVECLVALFEAGPPARVRAAGVSGAWIEAHEGAVWPREGTLAALCADTAQPLEISRSEHDAEPREPLNGGPMGSVRMVPLPGRSDAAPFGVLAVYRSAPRGLTAAERTLVDSFAALVGLSLQRAIAQEESRRGEARLRLGVDLALDLAATLEPQEVVARLLQRAVDATGADRGTLGRIASGNLDIEASFDREGLPSAAGSVIRLDAEPVLLQVITERRPVRAHRLRAMDLPGQLGEAAARAAHTLSLPLCYAGEVIAVMVLQRRAGSGFDDADVEMAQVIGNIAGLALRNARLYESLQQADEARTTFTSMVVHEMRSPLTVIVGYLEMLGSGMFGDAPVAWGKPLDTVVSKSVELQALVDDLLFSTRLETGRLAMASRPIDLRVVIGEAVERAAPRARLLGAQVRAVLPRGSVVVETDASHVDRILDNLVNNALNYGGDQPQVTIALQPGDRVRITVADCGHGIHPDHQERIFERFYRVQDRTRYPGTGLGLFISRQLSERLGGSLVVEQSVLGVGTTFALDLPMHRPPDGVDPASGGAATGGGNTG